MKKTHKIDKDEELETLLQIVIQKYPELKKYTFSIRYNSLPDAFAECAIDGRKVAIEIDIDLKNENDALKIAAIASEISHIIKENTLSLIPLGLGSYVEGLIYEMSTTYRNYDERQTDIETIKRGFGKELLELLKYGDKDLLDEQEKSEGLNRAEIEAILKCSSSTEISLNILDKNETMGH